MRRIRTAVSSTLVLLFVSAPGATTVVPADLGELSRDARIIVRGTVIATDGRWIEDRRSIETLVTLKADEYLKGALGATVQFRVPGGRVGRLRRVMIGAPEFGVGQQTVVFLGSDGPRLPHLLGLGQGVFRVARDRDAWVVTPSPVTPTVRRRRVERGDPSRRPMPLAEFERRVRVFVRSAR